MPHPRIALLLPALLMAGALAACFGPDDPQTERTRRARAKGSEVVIGAAWPWEARKNVLYWQGIEMAVAETNSEGGVLGRSVRIVRADDQESVDQGRIIAQEFGKNPDMVAVIGHLQSYVTVPAAAIYDLSGLVLVSATATTSELTGRGYRRTFRTIFTDVEVGRQMAEFAVLRGYRRMAIYYARDENGRGLANAFEEQVSSHNLQIIDRQSYDPNTSATARIAEQAVEAWKNLNVDAVFVAGQDEPAARLAVELRRRGIGAAILGGDALATSSYLQIAGPAAEGTVIGTPFHADMPAPEARRFAGAFRKRYGKDPDVGAALGYDAVRVLVQGMRKAPSVDPGEIAAALHQTRGWQGVTGRFTFDEAGGLVDMPIRRVVVRDGVFRYHGDPAPAP